MPSFDTLSPSQIWIYRKLLTDLGSANGTFVNGTQLSSIYHNRYALVAGSPSPKRVLYSGQPCDS